MSSLIWIGFLLPVILFFFLKNKGKELTLLAKEGQQTKATIIERNKQQSSKSGSYHYKIKYVFKTKFDESITGKASVAREFYHDNAIGDEIDIVYFPQKPQISAIKYLVDLVAGAISKKSKTIQK